jgi:hypothetical protein
MFLPIDISTSSMPAMHTTPGEWDWEKEQANVENDFNVIETGEVHLLGQSRPLNIVHFQVDSPQTISFYISIIDTLNKKQLYLKSYD